MQGVRFRIGDLVYCFGAYVTSLLLCNYLLFSEAEGNVAQGSKHGPWSHNALVRGLNLLPVLS